jgi:hypothetical protein
LPWKVSSFSKRRFSALQANTNGLAGTWLASMRMAVDKEEKEQKQ